MAAIQYFNKWPGMARMNTQKGITARLFGSKQAMAALVKKIAGLNAAGMSGLLAVAVEIEREMDTTYPKVPIDTGALRASFKKIPKMVKGMPAVEIGWPQGKIQRDGEMVDNYAAYVHEMTSPPYGPVNWSRPESGPKFFEAAVKRTTVKAPGIMATHIKAKGL